MSVEIVQYKSSNETEWLYCRVLSFLKTAYYNDVLTSKPSYKNPAIELVAILENKVVGLLDIEIESKPKDICSSEAIRSGMVHNMAVHPYYQRKKIAQMMLDYSKSLKVSLSKL